MHGLQPGPKAMPAQLGPQMLGIRTDEEYDAVMQENKGKTVS